MTYAASLGKFANTTVRKRGEQYFRQGRVTLARWGADQVQATVQGSSRYQVHMDRTAGQVAVYCSCPHFARDGMCKHIWATALAADRAGQHGGPADRRPGRRELPPPRSAPPETPGWRKLLASVAQPSAAPPPFEGEILYLIDVPATARTGRLAVQLHMVRRKLDGTLGRPAWLRLQRDEIEGLPDAADRQVLNLLTGVQEGEDWGYWAFGDEEIATTWELHTSTAPLLVPLLCATGRCRIRRQPQEDAGLAETLAWDDGEPWRLWLTVRRRAGAWEVSGSLRRGGERMAIGEPRLILQSGVLFAGERAARFDARGTFGWIPLLGRHGTLRVPEAAEDELVAGLLATAEPPGLDLPPGLELTEDRAAPRPRLRLRQHHGPGAGAQAEGELSFAYGGRQVPAGAPGWGTWDPEERRIHRREPEAEERAAERLRALGLRPPPAPGASPWRLAKGQVPGVVRTLLAEEWMVEAEGKLYRNPGAFQLGVTSGVDWFDLQGEAEFEGRKVALPRLLAALEKGEGFVPLDDGSLGLLPEEWARRLAPVAALGRAEGKGLRFHTAQAALLDAWLANEPAATCDAAFEQARERLRAFTGVAPAAPPPGFTGELRAYQRAGLGWLHFLCDFGFGGCLADDMGLGKTVQVLALLEARRAAAEGRPSLAVVPRSLVFNWRAEAARFTPGLKVLDHTGAGRAREGDPFAGWDLVLTTYGTLRRDVAALRQVEFDYLILDEAQAIKNAASATAKAARLLRARHRLALTGTPVENHLGELWSLLEFLNPGISGASSALRDAAGLRNPAPETRELLGRALRPFLLRRTKEQVAPELPAKTEQTLFCELPPEQRRLYDELRDHYRGALGQRLGSEGLGRVKILVLEALLRLRQAACHPGLVDRERADEPCAKLDVLLPQLREVLEEGHKALVFSQFTSFLGLLRLHLERERIPFLYLDGRTRDRQEKVTRFQTDPGCRLFLISLKAGGLGLNLTAADYVFLLDPWWNPAVEAQAVDRAHRIGQTRPVFAFRIVAKGTVEEKILELQKSKRELADAIVQADQSLIATLSREDLELLLS